MPEPSQRQKWRKAYLSQKHGAMRRGICWGFTFESWLEWWGEDIHRRGPGVNDLCMQRIGDVGPYTDWNVRKGTPLDNGRTRSKSVGHSRSLQAAARIHAASMAAESIQDHGDAEESDYAHLGYRTCEAWM